MSLTGEPTTDPRGDPSGGYTAVERMVRLEVSVGLLSAQVTKIDVGIDRLETTVQGRPSWLAATLLSISTMANGALLAAVVALITTRGK